MTIKARHYHPNIRKQVDISTVIIANVLKSLLREQDYYPNVSSSTLQYEVALNLIGLWFARKEHFIGEFHALICIDTATNLVECEFTQYGFVFLLCVLGIKDVLTTSKNP